MFKAIWSSIVGRKKCEWCCNAMKNLVTFRHDRGFFVYAERRQSQTDDVWFYLCFRAIEDHRTIEVVSPSPECISLASKSAIHFCPQCGSKLADYYRGKCDKFFDSTLDNFLSTRPSKE
jgi:hypothetical protein